MIDFYRQGEFWILLQNGQLKVAKSTVTTLIPRSGMTSDEVPIDKARWDDIVELCSFARMKKNATKSAPLSGAYWDAGAEVFINRGTNGRCRDVLTLEQ